MATIRKRFDLLRYRNEHRPIVLLGIFLQDGFLLMTLTDAERTHLRSLYQTQVEVGRLVDDIIDAAHALGLGNPREDWRFTVDENAGLFQIRDPQRCR